MTTQTSSRDMSAFQVLIVAICFILNFNDGIDVNIVTFSSSEIIKEWALTKTQMGYISSMGLAGMTLGCFVLAPWADKIGRRRMFLISLCLISFGMFGVAFTHNYNIMLFVRFLTGLGIGGILPSMTATAAEFSNDKYRDFNVGLVQAGWPVGSILTGFFCAYFIPQSGWHNAFLVAGCVSLLMLVLVYFFMTDSVEFLLKNQPPNALTKINAILQKTGQTPYETLPAIPQNHPKATLKDLFSVSYKDSTIKLWIAAFFGFLTLYTLMSWVSIIAKDAGLSFEMAIYVGIALNLGAAIGSTSIGAIGSRFGLRQAQFTFMLCAFVVMQLYANLSLSTNLIFGLIFLIGIFVQGGFNGIWPILARVYPAEIRTTGVGFTVGIGRFGAILGPTLFGFFSDSGLSIHTLFIVFSLPLLVMGFCVWKLKAKTL
jgi:MFS transporter, AAHS family, 4-hydroxybenzoate transporter